MNLLADIRRVSALCNVIRVLMLCKPAALHCEYCLFDEFFVQSGSFPFQPIVLIQSSSHESFHLLVDECDGICRPGLRGFENTFDVFIINLLTVCILSV